MNKNVLKIFLLGFIWVIAGIAINIYKDEENAGSLVLAIGLLIESLALVLFFWKKIKQK